jgi:hypothetical protein
MLDQTFNVARDLGVGVSLQTSIGTIQQKPDSLMLRAKEGSEVRLEEEYPFAL